MTYEKALKTINMNLQVAIHDLEGLEPEYEKNQIEALKISREAIEKQIKKKPIKKTNFGSDILDGKYCPRCDLMFDRTSKYCECCGQALDWSE